MAITQDIFCERVVGQRVASLSPGESGLVKELCEAGISAEDIVRLIWTSRALRLKKQIEQKLGRALTHAELLRVADLLASGKSVDEIADLIDGPTRNPAP